MLSIVVIGRNDSHGYNLNKRVATSLNLMATLLDEEDEIIFVDWNTPVTLPTMPVAIQSDLSPECKALLKVARVTPRIHNAVKKDSNRQLLEPIARNVGIRLADRESKWILSTNTDMIFLTNGYRFSHLLKSREQKLWTCFRYELPEYLWESLDSRDPAAVSDLVSTWDSKFDLQRKYISNVDGNQNLSVVDAVGDFQLAPKDLWHAITGFPEEMLDGWHVDTRTSLAFEGFTNEPSGIFHNSELIAYHQNHLRTLTTYHENHVNNPDLALVEYRNDRDWGLSQFNLVKEDFSSLVKVDKALTSLNILNFQPIDRENSLAEIERSQAYDLSHVAIYLTDVFVNLPDSQNILIASLNQQTINFVKSFLNEKHSLTTYESLSSANNDTFDLVILDFGLIEGASSDEEYFFNLMRNFLPRIQKWESDSTIFVFIRVQNWGIRTLVRQYFSVPLFNNYTQLLVGGRRSKVDKSLKGAITAVLAYWGAVSDYNLGFKGRERTSALAPFGPGIFLALWRIYHFLPIGTRRVIKRFVM